jgi:hypothetical protein
VAETSFRWVMGTGMIGAGLSRRGRRFAAEGGENDSQNGDPAPRPVQRVGALSCRYSLGRNGSPVPASGQGAPMRFHRDDPLIGDLDGGSAQTVSKRKLHHYLLRDVPFGSISPTFF